MKETTIKETAVKEVSQAEMPKDKAYEKVVQYVKDKIINNELQIGDKLPTERELSEKLELSRNSVREALRTMDNMGLIACRQGSGNYLTGELQGTVMETFCMMFRLNQISDKDISQLRRAIDLQAMHLAVKNFRESDLPEAAELLRKLQQSEETGAEFLDKEVHMLISKYSQNKLIEIINESLSKIYDNFIIKARKAVIENDREILSTSHMQMVQSLMENDLEKGIKAINQHYDIIEEYIFRNPTL